jgi:hypothetical protein
LVPKSKRSSETMQTSEIFTIIFLAIGMKKDEYIKGANN